MTAPTLVERLADHRALHDVPRVELEWLAAHGQLQRYDAGFVLATPVQMVEQLLIMLSGRICVYVDRGAGRRKMSEWHGGDVTGVMPYSRLRKALGDIIIEDESEALTIDRSQFREMTRECPEVTAILVHAMLDRARQFTSTDLQNEKMMSLGRLAAGLAHELNNPASAVARSAKLLAAALPEAEQAAYALGAARLGDAERAVVDELRTRSFIPTHSGVFSAIERSDREDEVLTWLADHGAQPGPAETLAETGIDLETLDTLAQQLDTHTLDAALRSLAATLASRALTADIERAASKIHNLVSSVKRFTYMDRGGASEPFSIAQGLADTVAMLASKAKAKSATVRLDVPPDLPRVRAFGELNQVWTNLLENALDAIAEKGRVVVSAICSGPSIVVRVVDDGPGIPPEVMGRIFDPFFTTKPIGQGTGLGLDIARRIVFTHEGQLEVESKPGHTEFRVTLPTDPSAAAAPTG